MRTEELLGRASGHVPETLHNIRTIHTLGKENYMAQRYDEYICESYTAIEKNNFYDALYSPVILILNAIVVAVVMLFQHQITSQCLHFWHVMGTAVAVINYISQIFAPVENLGMEIQTIQSAIAGVHRINEFFELDEFSVKKDLYIVENTAMAADSDVLVDFNNVTFSYDDDKNVVENLSFSIKKASGLLCQEEQVAGKSTIFKLLLGLYDPDNGSVLIAVRRRQPFQIAKRERYMDMSSRLSIWFLELSKTRLHCMIH